MRRLLIVAADKALTRFIAEAMVDRPLTAPARPTDAWDIARAHSGLEAITLVAHGGRPFDCAVLDPGLEDTDVLEVVAKLRQHDEAKDIPIFLLSERGRDQHSRRIAVEKFNVAGFIEKPVTAEGLREALQELEHKRRILLVEGKSDIAARYQEALRRCGYAVEVVTSGMAALDRVPRLLPELVVSALILDDMSGIEVCVEVKRAGRDKPVPVVLYGQVSALVNVEIAENAHRADDFVQAPFDDEILVERVGMLIGRGTGSLPKRRRKSSLTASPSATAPDMAALAVGTERPTMEGPPPTPGEPPAGRAPPPSASPSPVGPARRSTRRVPCNLSMRVENQGQIYTSKTLDISHGGIFLATEEPIEIGTKIEMTFQIPHTEHAVSAVGKVAWAGKGGTDGTSSGVGVKFSRIDPTDLKLIVDYVNRVSRVVYSAT